ncbi:hypothetical protein D917_07308 [Trichinella nativa]|uniref:Uncharacterized protein n=1 Tax=Trichinella nativa TaxID=6335 RepID=A0A1Y3ET73_9BILA|nr:hypothetical protein D917_07308 [Trichinella nativa]
MVHGEKKSSIRNFHLLKVQIFHCLLSASEQDTEYSLITKRSFSTSIDS